MADSGLGAVRLGCNLNDDKLQDLAEQHRALRHIMEVGDWDEDTNFSWRRIRDNVLFANLPPGHSVQRESTSDRRTSPVGDLEQFLADLLGDAVDDSQKGRSL